MEYAGVIKWCARVVSTQQVCYSGHLGCQTGLSACQTNHLGCWSGHWGAGMVTWSAEVVTYCVGVVSWGSYYLHCLCSHLRIRGN